jgi:general stress protein 26
MDSINRNQPEENRRDLAGAEAIERIKDIIDDAETGFFITGGGTGDSRGVRPMSVRETDDNGAIWYLGAIDSHTNQELQANPTVKLFFQSGENAAFLELWEPLLKTWFTEGEDDPRIIVIKVTPKSGYYWDNKHGGIVAGAKMAIGAVLGKTLDDSIEGTLTF